MSRGVGTGTSRGGQVRVKTARKRTASSTQWLARQLNDPYVAAAKAQGYRSRAAFKLIELDAKYGVLKGVRTVVDLGAAPGGWLQVVQAKAPQAQLVGIDLLPITPLALVTLLEADFLAPEMNDRLRAALGAPVDLVLSDMAANTTGHRQTDHLRTMALAEAALDFAAESLAAGGCFVTKVFAGGAEPALLDRLKKLFTIVKHAKPAASRKESPEWYVVAKGFRG